MPEIRVGNWGLITFLHIPLNQATFPIGIFTYLPENMVFKQENHMKVQFLAPDINKSETHYKGDR